MVSCFVVVSSGRFHRPFIEHHADGLRTDVSQLVGSSWCSGQNIAFPVPFQASPFAATDRDPAASVIRRINQKETKTPITTDEEVRFRAYQIWDEEGRPEGRDKEHWQRASDEATIARGDARDAADADLARDPGIGNSSGTTGLNPLDDKGANSFEGDTLNDVPPAAASTPTSADEPTNRSSQKCFRRREELVFGLVFGLALAFRRSHLAELVFAHR